MNDPSASARLPPICGEIICITPNANVAALNAGQSQQAINLSGALLNKFPNGRFAASANLTLGEVSGLVPINVRAASVDSWLPVWM